MVNMIVCPVPSLGSHITRHIKQISTRCIIRKNAFLLLSSTPIDPMPKLFAYPQEGGIALTSCVVALLKIFVRLSLKIT